MDKPKFKEFKLPNKLLTQLYELTGGKESYKGFILAYSDENGIPIVYTEAIKKYTGIDISQMNETDLEEQESE